MSNDVLPPLRTRHRSLVDEIGSAVVAGRISGVLPTEDVLCLQLDVSRGALREAMKALTAKGLVEVKPRTGTRTRESAQWNLLDQDVIGWWWAADPDAVGEHVHELRGLLEPAAAVRAAQRGSTGDRALLSECAGRMKAATDDEYVHADVLFHIALWKMTGNPLLGSIGVALSAVLEQVFRCSSSAGRTAEATELHQKLADAIHASQADVADSCARALLAAASSDFAVGRKRTR